MRKVVVGSIVAFNTLPDAAWFEVTEIDGMRMKVREVSDDEVYAEQVSDLSLVKQVKKVSASS